MAILEKPSSPETIDIRLEDIFIKLLHKNTVLVPFDKDSINQYCFAMVQRAVMLAGPEGIAVTLEHPNYKQGEIIYVANEMQKYMFDNYGKKVPVCFIKSDGKVVSYKQPGEEVERKLHSNNIAWLVPAGYDSEEQKGKYDILDNTIYTRDVYEKGEDRTGLAKLYSLIEEQELLKDGTAASVLVNKWSSKNGSDPQIIKNNLFKIAANSTSFAFEKKGHYKPIEDSFLDYQIHYRTREELIDKLEQLHQYLLFAGSGSDLFIKLNNSASGCGVVSISRDQLFEIFGPINSNFSYDKLNENLEKTLSGDIKTIDTVNAMLSGDENAIAMEGFGEDEISVTFVKVDKEPYFKALYWTKNLTINYHHVGNEISNPETFARQMGFSDKKIKEIEDTLAILVRLWHKQNGVDLDSIKAGQVVGLDIRINNLSDDIEMAVIDYNGGRMNAPSYTVAAVKNILDTVPNVILQKHVEVDSMPQISNLTPANFAYLKDQGIIISPNFDYLDNGNPIAMVSVIFTGETKDEAIERQGLFNDVLAKPHLFVPRESFSSLAGSYANAAI